MSTANRAQVEELKAELSLAKSHLDREEWALARDCYLAVQEKAQVLGIESAYLLWCLSLAQGNLGDTEEAFRLICAAVVLDPMHTTLSTQFADAAEAMRRRLEVASHRPEFPLAERLYQSLLRAGEADAGSHVAMARAYLAKGALKGARTLLESTALLEPSRLEAWRLLSEVTRKQGDLAAAADAEARVAELAGQEAPYGIPSPATNC